MFFMRLVSFSFLFVLYELDFLELDASEYLLDLCCEVRLV